VLAPALRSQMWASGQRAGARAEAELDYHAVVSETLEAHERVLNPPASSMTRLAATQSANVTVELVQRPFGISSVTPSVVGPRTVLTKSPAPATTRRLPRPL
jgi:hypothetical protein